MKKSSILIVFVAVAFTSCKFSRKLEKTEVKRDTVAVATVDSSYWRDLLEQSSKATRSTQTVIEKPGTVQVIPGPAGETKYVYLPGEKTTIVDNSSLENFLRHENDSLKNLKKDSSGVSTSDTAIKSNTFAGMRTFDWLILAVLLVIGGSVVYSMRRRL